MDPVLRILGLRCILKRDKVGMYRDKGRDLTEISETQQFNGSEDLMVKKKRRCI